MKTTSLAIVIVPLAVLLTAACNKAVPATDGAPKPLNNTGSEVVAVSVGSDGFQPSSVHGNKGQRLSLQVTRTTDETCPHADVSVRNGNVPELRCHSLS